MNKVTFSALVGCVLAVGMLVACGTKNGELQPENGQALAGPAGMAGSYGTAAPPPATTAPPPATTAPPTATQPAGPPPLGAADPSVAALLQPAIVPLEKQFTPPYSKAIASPVGGMFQPNQYAEIDVMLKPNKCYTGMALGSPTLTKIEVSLVLVSPAGPHTLQNAQGMGPAPVVFGQHPNCFKNLSPVPVPAKFRMTAMQGFGPGMAKLYEK
jgi:hypothetical protein